MIKNKSYFLQKTIDDYLHDRFHLLESTVGSINHDATYPQEVQCVVGEPLSCDVLGHLLHHAGVQWLLSTEKPTSTLSLRFYYILPSAKLKVNRFENPAITLNVPGDCISSQKSTSLWESAGLHGQLRASAPMEVQGAVLAALGQQPCGDPGGYTGSAGRHPCGDPKSYAGSESRASSPAWVQGATLAVQDSIPVGI